MANTLLLYAHWFQIICIFTFIPRKQPLACTYRHIHFVYFYCFSNKLNSDFVSFFSIYFIVLCITYFISNKSIQNTKYFLNRSSKQVYVQCNWQIPTYSTERKWRSCWTHMIKLCFWAISLSNNYITNIHRAYFGELPVFPTQLKNIFETFLSFDGSYK